jgi:hypothetical protein
MSLNQTFRHTGNILGLAIGGLLLNLVPNNFQILMTFFGASTVVMALIIFGLAKEPTKTIRI